MEQEKSLVIRQEMWMWKQSLKKSDFFLSTYTQINSSAAFSDVFYWFVLTVMELYATDISLSI